MMSWITLLASLAFTLTGASLLTKVNVNALCQGTMLKPSALSCVYQASKDGFDSSDFHAKVDALGGVPSLVIASVKSGGGLLGMRSTSEIIGGYNPFGWSSVNDYRPTRKAFVFAVRDGEILRCNKLGGADAAIYDFDDEGPVWGSEALRISLNPRKTGDVKLVTSRLGSDYERIGGGSGGTGGLTERRAAAVKDGNSLLSGSSKGTLMDLEVYC